MENVVCTTKHGKEVKIIDFGLAQKIVSGQSIYVRYGTTDYCAPEVVYSEPVGKATDMWSLGIFAYILYVKKKLSLPIMCLLIYVQQLGLLMLVILVMCVVFAISNYNIFFC